MVERGQRLRKGAEFDTAYRKGTVTSGPLLALRLLPNGRQECRWGFAVGKRLCRDAVGRNRTKRRLREAAREMSVAPGYDLIVTARSGAIEAPFGDLRAALARVLKRANVLVIPAGE